ncbi:hypothetical protein [Streptococcus oricebi]|uniref:Uncharacterized protein n=1 Tax=Streptococcus oricebi TaxID=1547447 RepID=A0ABS5B3U8_9STRE|nr:hypothetical protein [Streptococcus oricebi]MBP2623346.1 hypothetical protein [Streptococcus oricebi]
MAIQQVTLIVPPDIQQGLLTGEYSQIGSVIRNSSGHIVRHLKEAKISIKKEVPNVAQKSLANKNIVFGIVTIGVLAMGGTGYYIYISKKQKNLAKKIIQFLTDFLISAQDGTLTEKDVDEFVLFLSKNEQNLAKLKLDNRISEPLTLVKEYTMKFAEANDFKVEDTILKEKYIPDNVIDLRSYLSIQKEIYQSDAL